MRLDAWWGQIRTLWRSPWFWTALLAVLPALAGLFVIARFGANVPFLDEFAFVPLVYGAKMYGVLPKDFMVLHNEHRTLIPRMIAVPLLLATKYDSRALMMISWVSIVGVLAAVLALARRAARGEPFWSGWGLVAGALLFSLCHKATLLDGFQFAMALPNLLTVLALAWLTAPGELRPARVTGVAALLWMASACALNGLCGWPVAFLFVLLQARGRERLRALGLLTVGALLALALVWEGLARPIGGVDRGFFWKYPVETARFFFAMLGGPFTEGWQLSRSEIAQGIGLIGFLLGTVACVWTLLLRRRESYGLLAITIYALVAVLATVQGRASWGADTAAAQSRWMVYSVLFWIGGLLLLATLHGPVNWLRGYVVATGGFLLATLALNNIFLIREVRETSRLRREAAELSWLAPLLSEQTNGKPSSPYWKLFDLAGDEYAENVKTHLRMLSHIGFRRPAPSPLSAFQGFRAYIGGILPEPGPLCLKPGDKLTLRGWAILPKRNEPAQYIGITINRKDKFFTFLRSQREDSRWLLQFFPGNYANAGWRFEIPAEDLPKGKLSIEAWAYDPGFNIFLPLQTDELKEIVVE